MGDVPAWIPQQVTAGRGWQHVGTCRYVADAGDDQQLYLATSPDETAYAQQLVPAAAGPHTVAVVWMRLHAHAADPERSTKRA